MIWYCQKFYFPQIFFFSLFPPLISFPISKLNNIQACNLQMQLLKMLVKKFITDFRYEYDLFIT